jgi:hypothetical protein
MLRERPLAVIAGSVAQGSRYGGHVWVFLQYLLGLRRLGFEVLLIDRVEPQMFGEPTLPDGGEAAALHRLVDVLERHGLGDCFAVLDATGESIAGVSRAEAIARTRRSEFLLNVMGFLSDPELLAAAERRVFLDIDPGFPQMWWALGLADVFAGHERFATVGALVGSASCSVPECGIAWIHTRPPVVLELWPAAPAPSVPERRFLSIGAWRGPFAPIDFEGATYGLRVHEFRGLAALPRRTGARFDAALDIDPADDADAELLRDAGWRLLDRDRSTRDPLVYRELLARSGAELMVAKGIYARSRGGWFSDRSACFLASGRPVLALDTGFSEVLPVGRGLLAFDSLESAVEGARAIMDDYDDHALRAREIAEEWFDSDLVLSQLVAEVTAA